MNIEQYNILVNYGRWCHYLGIRGYKTGIQRKNYYIDDNLALKIDRIMQPIKDNNPLAHSVFMAHFFNGIEYQHICTYIKRNNKYNLQDSDLRMLTYINRYVIADCIDKLGDKIFLQLQEQERQAITPTK